MRLADPVILTVRVGTVKYASVRAGVVKIGLRETCSQSRPPRALGLGRECDRHAPGGLGNVGVDEAKSAVAAIFFFWTDGWTGTQGGKGGSPYVRVEPSMETEKRQKSCQRGYATRSCGCFGESLLGGGGCFAGSGSGSGSGSAKAAFT